MPAEPAEDEGFFAEPLDAESDELAGVTADEREALAPPAPVPERSTDTVAFAPVQEPQTTVEVPLEERARASMRGAGAFEPESPARDAAFEETSAEALAEAPLPPLPEMPEAAPEEPVAPPEPVPPAPAPVPDESFAEVAAAVPEAEPAPSPASEAAGVQIPVDQVEQIARRVVGQISEKVVREIAWEVIPDLAEALITKEIERLKRELQDL
jgi:hypothetical protein